MSKLSFKKIPISSVPTPKLGKVTLFVDAADDKVKVKFDDGSIKIVGFESVISVADKYHEQDFFATDTIIVNHNLDKIPSVMVLDSSSGVELQASITYDVGDINNKLTVTLNIPKTGKVVCN